MAKSFFDVYGCSLCEREVVTENGVKKEYVCCDLPMRMVKENTEFEKIDTVEAPVDKLSAVLNDEVGYIDQGFMGKALVTTPSMDVKVLAFKAGQETTYEKAGYDMSLFVVEGVGNAALGYDDLELTTTTALIVPKGMLWGIRNTGSSQLVILQTVNKNK